MTAEEYFGDWIKVIDKKELVKIMSWLKTVDAKTLCPSPKNIFKAFLTCPFTECKVIMVGLDPYPQPGVATGIMFGNSANQKVLSPSLQVIKEACINFEIPHNNIMFDQTLESWAKQGILMLNTALTCEVNYTGSHSDIWRPFISKLITNISRRDSGLVWVLFGAKAQSFERFIDGTHKIIKVAHPAYFARKQEKMPYSVFTDINKFLKAQYNEHIEFYKEETIFPLVYQESYGYSF